MVNTAELHDNETKGNVISNNSIRVVWQKVGGIRKAFWC